MAYSLRSTSGMLPGALSVTHPSLPTGWQPNDLCLGFTSNNQATGGPLFTVPAGWTLLSAGANNDVFLIGKILAPGDTPPTFGWNIGNVVADLAVFTGTVYTDLTTIVDKFTERASTSTSVIVLNGGILTPSADGSLIILAGKLNKSFTSDGATFGSAPATFIKLGTLNPSGSNQSSIWNYVIQGTAAAIPSNQSVSMSIADSSQNTQGFGIVLKVGASGTPVGDNETPDPPKAAKRSTELYAFSQVPIEIRQIPPAAPPPPWTDTNQPGRRPYPIYLFGEELNLLESTLLGQDRVLTPVDWQYDWEAPKLITALQYAGQGFDASDMTQLTNFAPYYEYYWPAPVGPRQWLRSWEAPINLCLVGADRMLTTGPNNLQWDPPLGARQPIANRSYEQKSLSLFYTVPVKPPPCGEWPLPLAARRPVQDFIQGTPEIILNFLSTTPPFGPIADLPPRKAVLPATFYSYEYSQYALLYGKDILPFGTKYDQQTTRAAFNRNAFGMFEENPFFIPAGSGPNPPPPPSGPLGVRHVGRIVIDPAKIGEGPLIAFDFISGMIEPSEILLSATTTCTLYSGTDPSPQNIIIGAATVQGTIAFQKCVPTIVGNIYDLSCKAITNAGQILILDAYFAIVPALP